MERWAFSPNKMGEGEDDESSCFGSRMQSFPLITESTTLLDPIQVLSPPTQGVRRLDRATLDHSSWRHLNVQSWWGFCPRARTERLRCLANANPQFGCRQTVDA